MMRLDYKIFRVLRRSLSAVLILLLLGCESPPISDGRAAPTANLALLDVGVSSEAEVRAALGEPRGSGFVRYSAEHPDRRPIWYYELVQVKGEQVGLKILLVFFSDQKYDGHLWFAAQELTRLGEP